MEIDGSQTKQATFLDWLPFLVNSRMKYHTFTGSLRILHSLPPPLCVHITYSESERSFRQTLGQCCLASRSLPRSRFGSARSTTALLSHILRGLFASLPAHVLPCLCATSRVTEGSPNYRPIQSIPSDGYFAPILYWVPSWVNSFHWFSHRTVMKGLNKTIMLSIFSNF